MTDVKASKTKVKKRPLASDASVEEPESQKSGKVGSMAKAEKKTAKKAAGKLASRHPGKSADVKAQADAAVGKPAKKIAKKDAVKVKGDAGKSSGKAKKTSTRATSGRPSIDPDGMHRLIREAAYYRAERRGFEGGDPKDDWMAAEAEISQRFSGEKA